MRPLYILAFLWLPTALLHGLCFGQQGVSMAYTAPHIGSVRLHPLGAPLGGPFMELNGDAPLILRFDDLSGEWPEYEWTLVHCSADWSAVSDLTEWDYLEGWAPATLDNIENSFGGSIPFAHVATAIPSEDLRPTRSGNYLLVVHAEGDPDNVALIRRFIVFERLAEVEMTLRRPFEADKVSTHQRLEIEVALPPGHRWSVPMMDIRLTALRNVDWSQGGYDIGASMVRGDLVTFNQDPQLTFPGSDRWRSADLKSLSYLAPGIKSLKEAAGGEGPSWKVELGTDQSRRFRLQTSRPDLKGAFTVHNDRFDDVELTSEYMEVTFSLSHPDFGDVPEVFVFGGLTGWSLDPGFRMTYNESAQEYRLKRWLKQGWYDYRYVTLSDGRTRYAFEADHAGTPNLYSVFIHAPSPDGADRIIGVGNLSVN